MRPLPVAACGEVHPCERAARSKDSRRIRPSATARFTPTAAVLLAETGEADEPATEQPVTTAANAAKEIKRRGEDETGFTNAASRGTQRVPGLAPRLGVLQSKHARADRHREEHERSRGELGR